MRRVRYGVGMSLDGFLLTWLDYEGGLDRFGREVLPRLEKAGLRAAAEAKV